VLLQEIPELAAIEGRAHMTVRHIDMGITPCQLGRRGSACPVMGAPLLTHHGSQVVVAVRAFATSGRVFQKPARRTFQLSDALTAYQPSFAGSASVTVDGLWLPATVLQEVLSARSTVFPRSSRIGGQSRLTCDRVRGNLCPRVVVATLKLARPRTPVKGVRGFFFPGRTRA